jgi:hypothetical protein
MTSCLCKSANPGWPDGPSLPHFVAFVPHAVGRTLFVAQGGHRIQAAGSQSGQIARQDGHYGKSTGG